EQDVIQSDKEVSNQVEKEVNDEVPESSGNLLPTASDDILSNESSEPLSTPAVEITVPTDSLPILTVIKSRGRGFKYTQPPSIVNAVSSQNSFRDTADAPSLTEVEADLSNMETDIQFSPTPTFRINKDHLKNQI
ncbi:hypothetical protein Tco_1260656, partial [Tanacetum coccineum]